jgi:hypothetical protein
MWFIIRCTIFFLLSGKKRDERVSLLATSRHQCFFLAKTLDFFFLKPTRLHPTCIATRGSSRKEETKKKDLYL